MCSCYAQPFLVPNNSGYESRFSTKLPQIPFSLTGVSVPFSLVGFHGCWKGQTWRNAMVSNSWYLFIRLFTESNNYFLLISSFAQFCVGGGLPRKPGVPGKVKQVTHPFSRKSPSVMGLVFRIFLPYIPLVWRQSWLITDAGAAEENRASSGSGGR